VLTAVAFLLFGDLPWVAGVALVPWLVAGTYVARNGHRAFKTGANTDLFLLLAGFGIAAAIVARKFAPH
jgi:hypothetical protein